MDFSALPLELLGLIVNHVQPDDLLNTCLTCHQLHYAAIDSLRRHEALAARYSRTIINCNLAPEYTDGEESPPPSPGPFTAHSAHHPPTAGDSDTLSTTDTHTASNGTPRNPSHLPTNHFRSPITLLHALESDPAVAWHVREIHFLNADTGAPLDGHVARELAATDLDALLCRAAPWLGGDPEDRELWAADIEGGNHGTALALLLGFLPNLRAVHLAGLLHTYSCWLDMLVRGLARCRGSDSDMAAPGPLGKVESVHIEHLEDTGGESLHSILPLTMLPSLRRLSVFMASGYDIFHAPVAAGIYKALPGRTCPLRELELASSAVSPATLARFVAPMHMLETLSYEHGGHTVAGPPGVEIGAYREEFVKEARDWLREGRRGCFVNEEGVLEVRMVGAE